MEEILTIVDTYSLTFIIVALMMNLFFVFLFIFNFRELSHLRDRYRLLTRGTRKKNIEGILMEHIDKVEGVERGFKNIEKKIDILENRVAFSIQNVGVVRYNAFNNVGSDLSYSIALLDENYTGVILTGIHGREETVSYAKPVVEGESNYNLSVEELQALERAKAKDLYSSPAGGYRTSN